MHSCKPQWTEATLKNSGPKFFTAPKIKGKCCEGENWVHDLSGKGRKSHLLSRSVISLKCRNNIWWHSSSFVSRLRVHQSSLIENTVYEFLSANGSSGQKSMISLSSAVFHQWWKKKNQMRIQRRVIFNGLMVGLIERHACLQRWQAASKMDLERHDGELLTFVVFYSESEKLMTADGDPECVRKWNWLNLDRQY